MIQTQEKESPLELLPVDCFLWLPAYLKRMEKKRYVIKNIQCMSELSHYQIQAVYLNAFELLTIRYKHVTYLVRKFSETSRTLQCDYLFLSYI